MRILITGGAGFVGSHLADLLLAEGHHVTVIDDLSTGSMDNIAHLRANGRFRYVIEDVNNRLVTENLVDQVDCIFHLAAAVGVKLIVEDPVRTIETNIRATELLLELAAREGTRILVASTSEVYGKQKSFPFNEESDLVLGPTSKSRWSYAASKIIDEFLALAYVKEYALPTVVVRLFNTVGPRQTGQYGMVIPRFVEQALGGDPITVYGDGSQRRCFGHVSDSVWALARLMEEEDAVGRIFNVGNDEEVTILELAERVRELTGSSSEIVHVPYEEAYEEGFEDMERRVPDLTAVRELIGYRPTRDLDRILGDVIHDQTPREAVRAG